MSHPSAPSDPVVAGLLAKTTFAPGEGPLEIACSGGPDSTALAVLACATGRSVVLHHVDHGLRSTSADEGRHVAALAAQLGCDVELHTVAVPSTGNLEEEARLARRSVLPSTAATGHTMDDQAETVLVNLVRGAGASGLGAMRPGPRHPILRLRRADTHGLCRHLGLSVVHDESNEDLSFVRNQVRRRVLPLLDEIGGRDLVPLLDRTAAVLRADEELLTALAADAVPDPTDVAALRAAPRPLSVRALRVWLTEARRGAGRAHPPSAAEIARVLTVVDGAVVATELAGGYRVARRAGRLRVERA